MIPRDHDYDGKERDKHMMHINCWYDGDLLWICMDGCHSWTDGCYTHEWTHAMRLKTFEDIINSATNAVFAFCYQTQVIPQLEAEIGEDYWQCVFYDSSYGDR